MHSRAARLTLAVLALAALGAAWLLLERRTEEPVPGGQGGPRPTERERPDALSLTGSPATSAPSGSALAPAEPDAPEGCVVECTFVWPAGVDPTAGEAALMRQDGQVLVSAKAGAKGMARLELAGALLGDGEDWLEVVGIVEGHFVEPGTLVRVRPGARVPCPLRVHAGGEDVSCTGRSWTFAERPSQASCSRSASRNRSCTASSASRRARKRRRRRMARRAAGRAPVMVES